MVDIHSAIAEIRRGKEKERKKKRDKNIMSTSAAQGGHNNRPRTEVIIPHTNAITTSQVCLFSTVILRSAVSGVLTDLSVDS